MRRIAVISLMCLSLAACAGDGEFRAGLNGAGLVGPPGPQGAQGEAGAQGANGHVGAQGGIGPQGHIGASGVQGPAGPPGSPGQSGNNGNNGGVPEIPGIPGVPGLPGVPDELADSNGSLRGGLGITGNGGLFSNIIGNDPVSGPTSDTLGQNNAVDHFLGAPPDPTQQGVIPGLAGALVGIDDGAVLGNGVGVTGNGGLAQDLLGSDVVSPLLGNSGVISDNISGGNDNLLGALLQNDGPQSVIQNTLPAVPTETVTNALNQAPALGILGTSGLAEDVLGPHPDGNLIGTDSGVGRVLGRGNDGALGSVLNTDSPPAAPVGETSTDVLNSLAGNNEPVLGDVAGTVPGGVTGDLPGAVTELAGGITEGNPLGGGLPGGDVGNTVGDLLNLDTGAVTETVTGVVDTVTSLADLGGLAGGSGGVGGTLPGTGDLLGGVTEGNALGGGLLGGGGGLLGGLGGNSDNPSARGSLRGR